MSSKPATVVILSGFVSFLAFGCKQNQAASNLQTASSLPSVASIGNCSIDGGRHPTALETLVKIAKKQTVGAQNDSPSADRTKSPRFCTEDEVQAILALHSSLHKWEGSINTGSATAATCLVWTATDRAGKVVASGRVPVDPSAPWKANTQVADDTWPHHRNGCTIDIRPI